MLSLITVFALHVPQDMYLRCKDFDWLSQVTMKSDMLTPGEKMDMILKWATHTDPNCFYNKDAND